MWKQVYLLQFVKRVTRGDKHPSGGKSGSTDFASASIIEAVAGLAIYLLEEISIKNKAIRSPIEVCGRICERCSPGSLGQG